MANRSTAPHGAPAPAATDPSGPARLRAWLEEALFLARRFAEDTWDDFGRRDRYFRMKAAILAVWVATSVFSFRVATAGPSDPAANGLGAYVAVTHTTMSWGLLVHNRSDEAWKDVRVVLDGGWVHQRAHVAPDEKVVLSPGQFSRGGQPAPDELSIGSVRIETDDGDAAPPVVR